MLHPDAFLDGSWSVSVDPDRVEATWQGLAGCLCARGFDEIHKLSTGGVV